jgi:hypothetical protein
LENRGRSGRRRRYSPRLRALALSYLGEQLGRGASAETVATELGVSGWSLIRWSRRAQVEAQSELRKVVLVAAKDERPTSLILVTPDGYRIEGLKGQEVRSVLEALR